MRCIESIEMGCFKLDISDKYFTTLKVVHNSLKDSENTYADAYLFGFQGQEMDNEWTSNTGSHLAFKYRIHDARIGRFLSVDPLTKDYPHNSPYAFSENKVIQFIELEGLEVGPNYGWYLARQWGAFAEGLRQIVATPFEIFSGKLSFSKTRKKKEISYKAYSITRTEKESLNIKFDFSGYLDPTPGTNKWYPPVESPVKIKIESSKTTEGKLTIVAPTGVEVSYSVIEDEESGEVTDKAEVSVGVSSIVNVYINESFTDDEGAINVGASVSIPIAVDDDEWVTTIDAEIEVSAKLE